MVLENVARPIIDNHFSGESKIVLYEGDTLDFLKTIPDNTVKLIISSPPYNVGKKYEDQVSLNEYLKDKEKVVSEFFRVLHSEGSICWEVGNYVEGSEVFPLDILYYDIFKNRGFKLRNRIIWHFGHGLHASKRFSGRYETILWFTKSDNYTFNLDVVRVPPKYPGKRHYKGPKKGQPSCNPKGKNPSDVWEIVAQDWENELWDIPNVKSNHPEKTIHQCQFPIELVERCVLALTSDDDFVLDPYAGVGSALIAALKQNRRAIGIEKQPEYNLITRQRIHDFYAGKLKIRPLGKPVYQPTGKEKVARLPVEWEKQK
ncbi:MAG: DNA-methyltransferase [Candidatus Hodarchaeota archaeon]